MERNELTKLTQAIATALGSEWYTEVDAEIDGWARRIYHKLSKKVLYISVSYKGDKVNVGGSLAVGPNGRHVDVYKVEAGSGYTRWAVPDIGVSISRGPQVIATEIKRRLLPEYDAILALALASVKKDEDYAAAKLANVRRMAKAADKGLTGWQEERSEFSFNDLDVAVDVKAGSEEIDIKLNSLTPKQGEALLNLIRSGILS